ncbi:hypothetical protein SOVF_159220 [Spinacia oleracea]|nr:hypothetical protein SOVF_159220 [Spinacia oleracea]
MGVFSNKISKDTLKQGDHIYSWRNAYLYSHHGIYAGDGKVIHFTRGPGQEIGTGTFLDNVVFSSSPSSDRTKDPCPVCGDQSNLSGVISSCLDCFLWDGELYLFEYKVSPAFFLAKARGGTCTMAPSDTPEDVVSRASFLLENGFGGYNIFKNNCEDFAIYCKTGLLVITDISVGRSGQATAFVAAVSAVVSSPLRFLTTSCGGLAAVGCGMYCVSRLVSDIGMRRDVMKVPVQRLVMRCDLDQAAETETAKLGHVSSCKVDQPSETETGKLGHVSSCEVDQPSETETAKLGHVSSCEVDQPSDTATSKQD